MKTLAFLAAVSTLVLTAQSLAHEDHKHPAAPGHQQAAASSPDNVPLWANLGLLTYRVTTSNALAQRYFDQGLMLAYGFNHAEARRSFQAAQRLDPSCALCFWGEALVLGPNINAPMDPSLNAAALEALQKAKALSKEVSTRERVLIDALAARYSADPKAERAALDRAYADAMVKAAAQFPDDLDIATLAAEALMDLSPWDYWQAGGSEPKGRTAEMLGLLVRVLARNPEHTGAIHLYIHAVEASDRPERAEPYADRLARQDLGAGHLAHMPSHIYYRIGRYADSLAANRKAIAADEAFLAKVKSEGIYAGGYYPHNIHFLMVSAQMVGDGATVIDTAEKLENAVSDEVLKANPPFQPIKAAPFFAHAQFSDPDRILALARPTGDMPYVAAMWHYARGTAHARKGDFVAARGEADAIARIAAEADFKDLAAAGVPATDVLALARNLVLGRVAQESGESAAAVKAFEAAVSIEDQLAYMEPPFWYYPVRQSLGAALLLAGEPLRAEQVFRESLEKVPNNGWALYGLQQAQRKQGNVLEAEKTARRLDQLWVGDRAVLTLARL